MIRTGDEYRESIRDGREQQAIGLKLPHTQQDWWDKKKATDSMMNDIGSVATRVGDETVGEMWSLFDGQVCVTPNHDTFNHPEVRPWMEKYYTINENWTADDRRKLLAFSRDLCNSDYAGQLLTFQEFAQSPRFAHLETVYHNFDFDGPADLVRQAAGLSPAESSYSSQVDSRGHGGFLGTTVASVREAD